MARARAEERLATPGWRERARSAVRRARHLEPEWVVPERFLDDLARAEGHGHAALDRRQRELHRAAEEGAPRAALAGLAYLVGRLEGESGVARFDVARRLDPALGWAYHGRAWMAFLAEDLDVAVSHGRRALEQARDPWERATFGVAFARYLLAADRPVEALDVLESAEAERQIAPGDRNVVLAWLARTELTLAERPAAGLPRALRGVSWFERGFWRGLALLRDADLARGDLLPLVVGLQDALASRPEAGLFEELELALAARPGDDRTDLRARLLAQRGHAAYSLGLVPDGGGASAASRRAAQLAQGELGAVVEAWLAALPEWVLEDDGLPRRTELRELVTLARAGTEADSLAVLDELAVAEALLRAGWFEEARGWASFLARSRPRAALEVDARALAGQTLLEGVRRILEGIDAGAASDAGREVRSLEELLEALAGLFERCGLEARGLAETPRMGLPPLAEVLHPGPRFSSTDQRAGRGRAGEGVPGLAAAFAALGRFGLFGYAIGGGGPDGTLLRLLAIEERQGEHLGVAYRGTVAWCEGVDVPSRPARQGARIVGAALHEGYWVDLEGVRRELELWRDLGHRFAGPDGLRRARELLAVAGPRPETAATLAGRDPGRSEHAVLERRRAYAPLGEGDRVRLAVLLDRCAGGAELDADAVTLSDLLEVTARHEEGHLLERTRFLPVLEHPLAILRALADAGFTPWSVSRRLEYRAQLVALCVVADPRLVLAECLDALEGGGAGTPHAEAFGELLEDWLSVLSERLERHPELDPERYLIHQVHRLGPEAVRALARELAVRRGLVAGDS